MTLAIRDQLDAFAALGLRVYLDDGGALRVRGPTTLIDAARPALRRQRAAIRDHLASCTGSAVGSGPGQDTGRLVSPLGPSSPVLPATPGGGHA